MKLIFFFFNYRTLSNVECGSEGEQDLQNEENLHTQELPLSTATSPSLSSSTTSRRGRQRACEPERELAASLKNFIDHSASQLAEKEEKIDDKKKQLMVFFDDIAETIKHFSIREQAEIKGQIFNIVNKKQLEILRSQEMQASSSETATFMSHQQGFAHQSQMSYSTLYGAPLHTNVLGSQGAFTDLHATLNNDPQN